MATQQTVQVIGNSNSTIAEVTTTIDAMLETPKACSLQASGSVGFAYSGGIPTGGSDQIILSFRWEDSFSNGFIKKVRIGLGHNNAAGAAGLLTFKLFRVNNFVQQYSQTPVNGQPALSMMVPTLHTGQTVPYSASGGNFNATDNVVLPTSGPLVVLPITAVGATGLAQAGSVAAAAPVIDRVPLAAITMSRQAVAGAGHLFNVGGYAGNLPVESLWEVSDGDYPIYLKKGEGIVVVTNNATGAGPTAGITLCFDAVPIVNEEY